MRKRLLAACIAAALLPAAAHATDGYFSHGYGMKAKGMAGASIAVAQDAFGGANNPATMAFAGNQFALGVDLFSPHRKAERTGGAGFGAVGGALALPAREDFRMLGHPGAVVVFDLVVDLRHRKAP